MKKSTKFIMDNRNEVKGINPFVRNLIIKVKVDKVYDKRLLDTYIERTVELEADRYLKLFCYSSMNRQEIRNLSSAGHSMFIYIITELLPNEDVIRINRKKYAEDMAVKSFTTISNAISELIDKCFIAPTSQKELYWINPDIFFTGNRISKYRETANIEQTLIR